MSLEISESGVAEARASIRRALIAGALVLAALIFGLLRWASVTEITSAVIADGTVVVESSVRRIRHAGGGTIKEVKVRNGDRVNSGEILIRLDGTRIQNEIHLLTFRLLSLRLRLARLTAERDNAAFITIPEEATSRTADPAITDMIANETSLFESQRAIHKGQRAEFEGRIAQLKREIATLIGQSRAKTTELGLIEEELRRLDATEDDAKERGIEISAGTQKIGTAERRLTLRREAARLRGERGQLRAAMAQLRARISEIEMQLVRLDHEGRRAVITDLATTAAATAELQQKIRTASDELHRLDITAPITGIAHELSVRGPGDVIGAGEALLSIIPDGDRLVVDARIDPHQIDQVLAAKAASLRFSSFNQRTTPALTGALTRVSADHSRDVRTGQDYFSVRIEIEEQDLSRLGTPLVPGMPVEVHIETQNRTVLSYLLKPLEDQFGRAWKER